ncbi:unnamed protein product [Polarella glacialis]|uniref:EamA domain-containing protein n=1 Tax=Polarella glacialis TaxID=89957 RepID=A0A813HHR5_POLGL|nr:unnamed protein product [Polarella glacialis]
MQPLGHLLIFAAQRPLLNCRPSFAEAQRPLFKCRPSRPSFAEAQRLLFHCRPSFAEVLPAARTRAGGDPGRGAQRHVPRCAVSSAWLAAAVGHGASAAPVGAALSAPLLATVGLIFWDKHWHGSVFALNFFKCLVASLLFVFAAASLDGAAPSATAALALCASSFIGVVVGDTTWLMSIRLLGARRVLLVDSLKPFVAAALGGLLFRETATAASLLSMACAVLGVLMVSLERESRPIEETASSVASVAIRDRRQLLGYALAGVTLLLDVSGSAVTKRYGGGLGPWTIGAIRFGFAAVCLAAIAAVASVASVLQRGKAPSHWHAMPKAPSRWHTMPIQSARSWRRALAGVIFVTFLCPAASSFGLVALPLSSCLTLEGLGPVFTIPLFWILKGERLSSRAFAGSLLAVIGAVSYVA